jgi:hypothetical protein
MSVFANPSFYVSIFSSICFIASEILPFLPTNGNGLFHSIIMFLSKHNKVEPKDTRIDDIENKINSIIDKINKKETVV